MASERVGSYYDRYVRHVLLLVELDSTSRFLFGRKTNYDNTRTQLFEEPLNNTRNNCANLSLFILWGIESFLKMQLIHIEVAFEGFFFQIIQYVW